MQISFSSYCGYVYKICTNIHKKKKNECHKYGKLLIQCQYLANIKEESLRRKKQQKNPQNVEQKLGYNKYRSWTNVKWPKLQELFLLCRCRNSTSSRGLSKIVKVMLENCRQGANTSGHKAKGFKNAAKEKREKEHKKVK